MKAIKQSALVAILTLVLAANVYSQKKKLYGYIDESGTVIVEPKYDAAMHFHEGLAVIKENGKFGCINKTGEMVITPQYQYIGSFSQGLAPAGMNNKYGFINKSGQVVVPFVYDYVSEMTNQDFAYVRKNSSLGVVNKTGKEIIPCNFENLIYVPGYDRLPAKQNGSWGYMDQTGKVVIPCMFDTTEFFSPNGLAVFKVAGLKGLVDKAGKIVISNIFDAFYTAKNFNGFWAQKNDVLYLVNDWGNTVAIASNAANSDFSDGFARVSIDNKVDDATGIATDGGSFFINRAGDRLIPKDGRNHPFEGAGSFREGRTAVWDEEDSDGDPRWYYIDTFGVKLNRVNTYKDAGEFYNGIAWVSKSIVTDRFGGKHYTNYFAIGRDGNVAITGAYSSVAPFTENIAAVENNKKWGFIDKRGQTVVPFIYDQAGFFKHGLAYVKKDEKYGFVNSAGKLVVSPKYDYLPLIGFPFGCFPVAMETARGKKLWGLIDSTGKEITPIKYDEIETQGMDEKYGLIKVKTGDKQGFVNTSGREVVPPKFDRLLYLPEEKVIRTTCKDAASKDRFGFYSLSGAEIAPCKYLAVSAFHGNVAFGTTEDNQYWLINRSGKQVALPKQYQYYSFSDGMGLFVAEK
jgi:hypothetical protein